MFLLHSGNLKHDCKAQVGGHDSPDLGSYQFRGRVFARNSSKDVKLRQAQ